MVKKTNKRQNKSHQKKLKRSKKKHFLTRQKQAQIERNKYPRFIIDKYENKDISEPFLEGIRATLKERGCTR